jgi:hypothetical protein
MPESIPQIVIIVLFVIPGFVFTRIFGFSVPFRSREAPNLILDSLSVSCINYGLLFPLLWFILRAEFSSQHPFLFAVSWFLILFGFPALLAILVILGLETQRFQWLRRSFRLVHPVPKAWDYFFRQGKQCWVLAHLKDGKLVAGLYSTDSFTSSYPESQDIYLEKLCSLSPDGKMTGVIDRSAGAIIVMDQVQLLEF